MNLSRFTPIVFFLYGSIVFGQNTLLSPCHRLLIEADSLLKKKEFELAIYKFFAVRNCDPTRIKSVEEGLLKVFRAIDAEKKRADDQTKNAIRERNEAQRQQKIAEKRLRSTQNQALFSNIRYEDPLLAANLAWYNLHQHTDEPAWLRHYSQLQLDTLIANCFFQIALDSIDIINNAIQLLTLSPDGSTLAMANNERVINVWDLKTKQNLGKYYGHFQPIKMMSFSYDGKYLLTASEEGIANLWDNSTHEKLHSFFLKGNSNYRFRWNQDGTRVIISSPDSLLVWSVRDHHYQIRKKWTHSGLTAIAADGNAFLFKSNDSLWVQYLDARAEVTVNTGLKNISSALFSADALKIMINHAKGRSIWDLEKHAIVSTIDVNLSYVAISGDFSTLLYFDRQTSFYKVQKLGSNKTYTLLHNDANYLFSRVSMSTDGNIIVLKTPNDVPRCYQLRFDESFYPIDSIVNISGFFMPKSGHWRLAVQKHFSDGTLELLDADDRVRRFSPHKNYIFDLTFSQDGRYLLSGSRDSSAVLSDAHTLQPIKSFVGHNSFVNSVAISSNNKYVLTGSRDKSAKVWDLNTSDLLFDLKGHRNGVFCVAISPNNQLALTGSADSTARIWSLLTGKLIKILPHSGALRMVAYSPDGKLMVTSTENKRLTIWSNVNYTPVFSFSSLSVITALAFSNDSQKLAIYSYAGAIQIWDVPTGRLEKSFYSSKQIYFRALCFSPSNEYLYAIGSNGLTTWNTHMDAFEDRFHHLSLAELAIKGTYLERSDALRAANQEKAAKINFEQERLFDRKQFQMLRANLNSSQAQTRINAAGLRDSISNTTSTIEVLMQKLRYGQSSQESYSNAAMIIHKTLPLDSVTYPKRNQWLIAAYDKLTHSALYMRKFSEAVAGAKAWLVLEPLSPMAHLLLGNALALQQKKDSAKEVYSRLKKIPGISQTFWDKQLAFLKNQGFNQNEITMLNELYTQ